ncbi:MAG TPA: hypothetical protein VF753_12115 [Terriglobales bacterium]
MSTRDNSTEQMVFLSCGTAANGSPFYPNYMGVAGTPVIDASSDSNEYTLYVVGAVYIGSGNSGFYLFAVDIRYGTVKAAKLINGSVGGSAPSAFCTTSSASGTINFISNGTIGQIQRQGLLLLNGNVYIGFADFPENNNTYPENGWMFGYSLSGSSFMQTAIFNSTPHGTGGGFWGAGAAPASDGTSIFTATGNGTTYDVISPINGQLLTEAGDSLLKLSAGLGLEDFYTPYDVFTFSGTNNGNSCASLCTCDEDFGSGGVMLPPNFTYTGSTGECSDGCSIAVAADKQSNIYVSNQEYLGQFSSGSQSTGCQNSTNNVQCIQTPSPIPGNDLPQGYWASPAYLTYTESGTTYNILYYSANAPNTVGMNGKPGTAGVAPMPINAYQLSTSSSAGPIPSSPSYSSTSAGVPLLFCGYSPTPSVSSDGATYKTGIVWAIEVNQNKNNEGGPNPDCSNMDQPAPAALHAFDASTLAEIYTTRQKVQTKIGHVNAFPTPTIFNGYVYMATNTEVDVFGLCSASGNPACLP